MYKYGFEKLQLWRDSKDFAIMIYDLTNKFPRHEKYGLISQLRRASISICSNIAEGTAYKSSKHQAHYSTMAYGSAMELINQLIISKELGLINDSSYNLLRLDLEKITNKINSLRNSQINQ